MQEGRSTCESFRASLLQSVRFPAYQHTFASDSLVTLSLSSNIGDVGAKELAGAIGASDWLTRADLLAAIRGGYRWTTTSSTARRPGFGY